MKRMYKLSALLMSLLALSFIVSSCSSTKSVARRNSLEVEGPESLSYCTGSKYQTDTKAFRATGRSTNVDKTAVWDEAKFEARGELATSIQALLKNVMITYRQTIQHQTNYDFERISPDQMVMAVKQILPPSRVICLKTLYNKKTGVYTAYSAVELLTNSVLNSAENTISNNELMKIGYDKDTFQKVFNKALLDLAKTNGNNN